MMLTEKLLLPLIKSDLNLRSWGSYNLIYKAVDAAGNEATRTVVVTVEEKDTTPPVNNGTKNFIADKDSEKPNWLQVLLQIDNKDTNPALTVDDSAVKMDTLELLFSL